MRFIVDVLDNYRTQSGFRESRSWSPEPGGPIYSEVVGGPVRAGELVYAASLAVAELGDLALYISTVELSFEKPKLVDQLWPRYKVNIKPYGDYTFTVTGQGGVQVCVRADDPFPTEQFVEMMVNGVREGLKQQIKVYKERLTDLNATLTPPAKQSVA